MKFTIVALVLAVCLIQSTEAWWGGLYGMGLGWGGLYGGYGGLYGGYGGLWGKRDTTEEKPEIKSMPPMNRTECVYNKNSSTILCLGVAETVECKVELKWTKEEIKREFIMYGIAKSETTPRSYSLLPRAMNNAAWLDHTHMVDGVSKEVSLFGSENLDHLGLRVVDEACWNRLDDLLKMSNRNEKVFHKVEGSTEMPTNFIVADLVVADISEEETSKRHWGGGYGYGGYRGGYGGYRGGYGGYRGGYGGFRGGYRGGYGGYRGGWRG